MVGHLIAVSVLTIVIVGIYGTIAWNMFDSNPDFRVHLRVAQRFYDTGRPYAPHFLFHGLTAALFATHLVSSFAVAGRSVMVGCYVAIPLLLYGLLWGALRHTSGGKPLVLFLIALATLLAQPITRAHAYALGYFWLEPYQIPTSTLLKPFALIGFACTIRCLSHRSPGNVRLAVLFALATALGSLSKPSFLICLAPAAAIMAVYRFVRRLPVSLPGLLAGLYVPAAAVLGWQFYSSYSGHGAGGAYHDTIIWSPLKFMSAFATNLPAKFLLSVAFPLTTTILYWRETRRDVMVQLSWLCFLFGAFYSYMLVEKAHWSAGNLGWSAYITAFTLFAGSVVFWVRRVCFDPPRSWFLARALLCGIILSLHVISGVIMDPRYLTHRNCQVDYANAEFVCPP
jgi:hypothetical protein